MAQITFSEADAVVAYDAETGSLKWKVSPEHGRMSAGKEIGYPMRNGYKQTQVNRRRCYAHQIAWLLHHGVWPAGHVDHINGDKADNRACNLRLANKALNGANRGPQANNTSGYKGVSWDRQKAKWFAQIGAKKAHKFLGYYATPEAAHEAYKRAAKAIYGDFARSV